MMPFFFPILNENITALLPILLQKIVKSLKNTLFSCLCFVKKRPLSQKHALPMSFFQIFHEKSLPVMPIFGQKNVNSVKTTLFYRPKNSVRHLFVRIYTKNTTLMPIFYQKTSILKKHAVLTPIFCKKISIRSKTQCSRVIFQNFHEKPLL